MVEGKTYIYPKEAKARLKLAKDEGINVYIYAMTGYGKTELVEHYLKKNNKIYLDAESSRLEEFNIPINSSVKKFPVVIDNLQFAGDDEIKAAIVELLKRRDLWIILISRAVYPDYLMSYRLKGPGFVEIGQEQLALSLKEASDFLTVKRLV